MICSKSDQQLDSYINLRGGKGKVTMLKLNPLSSNKNCKLFAEITLDPQASIGGHSHSKETEYYIIRQGEALVSDNGVEKTLKPGDIMITGDGDYHDIMNKGEVPLVFTAIIIAD